MSKSITKPPSSRAPRQPPSHDPELITALIQSHRANCKLHTILAAQVAGTLNTINTLVTEIVASSGKTQKSAEALQLYMTNSATTAESRFDRLRDAIQHTRAEQRQLGEQASHLECAASAARAMMEDQRELEGLGDKASTLGRRIRMVAMNTTIQAVHAGGGDAQTIKVLAAEISALAGDVTKLGEQLTNSVEALSRRVDRDVVNGVAKEAGATARMSQAMAAQVRELDAASHDIKDFRVKVWSQVIASTHSVNAHACQTVAGLQHQDIARQRLEQVAHTLALMTAGDQQLTAALEGRAQLPADWAPVQPEALQAGYVMADQRAAHDGEEQASTGPAIELF